MRSDKHLETEVIESDQWTSPTITNWLRTKGKISVSLSGHERNRLFLGASDGQFDNVSGISGLDTTADSRAWVMLDYDRDGWLDVALINSNAPLLNLFHNDLGDVPDAKVSQGQMIALRFVGSNHSPHPSETSSTRDGYGTRVNVVLGTRTLLREHRCGEGFASQHSSTMLIGIGSHNVADSVEVRWPTGKAQQISNIPAGTLLTVYENLSQSPEDTAFVWESYCHRSPVVQEDYSTKAIEFEPPTFLLFNPPATPTRSAKRSRLKMYTLMATWCVACQQSLPQLRLLRNSFDTETMEMSGIPIDSNDSPKKLNDYVAKYQPPYELLTHLSHEQISNVNKITQSRLDSDTLPATIITDGNDHLLLTITGIPSLSQLRKLLLAERDCDR